MKISRDTIPLLVKYNFKIPAVTRAGGGSDVKFTDNVGTAKDCEGNLSKGLSQHLPLETETTARMGQDRKYGCEQCPVSRPIINVLHVDASPMNFVFIAL
jgi:hypothetical protein